MIVSPSEAKKEYFDNQAAIVHHSRLIIYSWKDSQNIVYIVTLRREVNFQLILDNAPNTVKHCSFVLQLGDVAAKSQNIFS